MTNINNVQKGDLITKTAEELKKIKEITPPEWASYVKTGTHKERPPVDNDWWYARAASVMCKIHTLGPVGVEKLRTKYGGKKRRGHKPAEFRKAGGSILRKVLQQLEKAGLAKQAEMGVHKGRVLTPKGISILNRNATVLLKAKGTQAVKAQAPKKVVEKEAKAPAKEEKPKSAPEKGAEE